jgi:uncharacterized LabA/DUF88 family protein
MSGLPQSKSPPSQPRANRAMLFVDGSNFYHGLKAAHVHNQGQLDFAKISKKLVGPRQWKGTRYYVGQVKQSDNLKLYADQRSFVARQRKLDARIEFCMGRLEHRPAKDGAAKELYEYLVAHSTTIDNAVYRDLMAIANKHRNAVVMVEKAVDVMLAVDLVILAERDEYDTAYVLSADGDYTHAVDFARSKSKKVFAVSAQPGAHIAGCVDKFIPIDAAWVNDCYS